MRFLIISVALNVKEEQPSQERHMRVRHSVPSPLRKARATPTAAGRLLIVGTRYGGFGGLLWVGDEVVWLSCCLRQAMLDSGVGVAIGDIQRRSSTSCIHHLGPGVQRHGCFLFSFSLGSLRVWFGAVRQQCCPSVQIMFSLPFPTRLVYLSPTKGVGSRVSGGSFGI